MSYGAAAQTRRPDIDFKGRFLVAASDSDMQAQAYAGAPLGPPAPDVLSVIRLVAGGTLSVAGTVEASKSVGGPPASLAVSPDGRYAVLVETRGHRPADRPDARLIDLPPGRVVTVVDLAIPDRPVVMQRFTGRDDSISVSFRPDGGLVAIAYDTSTSWGVPPVLYDVADGHLTEAVSPAIPGFGTEDALKNAAFDPNGHLALVYATRPRLSLVEVHGTGRDMRLMAWGDDVPLGRTRSRSVSRPTGGSRSSQRHGRAHGGDGRARHGRRHRHRREPVPSGVPRHRLVSRARTGVLPEGPAVSPDARWVATTNLEGTAYAADDPCQGFFASVTLLRLDPQTG